MELLPLQLAVAVVVKHTELAAQRAHPPRAARLEAPSEPVQRLLQLRVVLRPASGLVVGPAPRLPLLVLLLLLLTRLELELRLGLGLELGLGWKRASVRVVASVPLVRRRLRVRLMSLLLVCSLCCVDNQMPGQCVVWGVFLSINNHYESSTTRSSRGRQQAPSGSAAAVILGGARIWSKMKTKEVLEFAGSSFVWVVGSRVLEGCGGLLGKDDGGALRKRKTTNCISTWYGNSRRGWVPFPRLGPQHDAL